jgi:rare lipoprotein A (peptidoglycan hydrolase)
MFFIKKQFKDIISWGIVSFCFFGGFSLFFYSFFIIYPLDEISKTEIENENIADLIIDSNVNVITKSLNNVKINVVTEKEFRENEIKKQEEAKAKVMKIRKQEEAKAMEIRKRQEVKVKAKAMEIRKRQELKVDIKVKAEIGIASWYCPKWCEKLAAAHPKYSKGTILKVTNLENKKSVIVIVNDFGPNKLIHPRRIIDLTKTAFQKIANFGQGTARVRVEKMIKQ